MLQHDGEPDHFLAAAISFVVGRKQTFGEH